jgi:hypothetical protein
MEVAIAG